MSRGLAILMAPELVVAVLIAVVFLVCARHHSYSDADVRVLERLLYLLPVVLVGAVFAGLYGTGLRTWGGLVRANLAVIVGLVVAGYRIVSGFGAPGSGPKGQDAGFIVLLSLGLVLSTVANAVLGTVILRAQKPAVAEWYRDHAVAGPLLSVVSMVPILLVQIVAVTLVASVAGMLAGWFKR